MTFAFQNDPEAHDRFLKVNRAYEVLKDEDLRKKYDKYGEKGFDDHKQGGQYESWNYYRYDFGECSSGCSGHVWFDFFFLTS